MCVCVCVCVCVSDLPLHCFHCVLASTSTLACTRLCVLHPPRRWGNMCVCVVWIGSVQPGMFSNASNQTDQGSCAGLSSVEISEKEQKYWFDLSRDGFGFYTKGMQRSGRRTSTLCGLLFQTGLWSSGLLSPEVILNFGSRKEDYLERMIPLHPGSSGLSNKLPTHHR